MIAARSELAATIQAGAAALVEPGSVVELRILNTAKATVSGYYTDLAALAEDAARWDGKAPAIYVTLNPAHPDLLARAVNRLREYARDATQNGDILRRRWFPLDFDPVRAAGISATDAEHDAALARALEVRDWLAGGGWPDPLLLDSGNGAHLLYRVDLANDAGTLTLVTRGLEALAFRFSDGRVGLDLKVGNAARIWKLPGTLACKGDPTPDRPHRRAALLELPAPLVPVPHDLLEALAAEAPKAEHNGHRPNGSGTAFDLDGWLAAHALPIVAAAPWSGGRKWILNPCPWNAEHTNRSAYLVQHASGAIAAGCHHNGCHGKGWHELRDLVEPGWRTQRERQAARGTTPADPPGAGALPTLDPPVAVLRQSKAQGAPIATGLAALDARLRGGMRAGKVLLIGGAPHAGKSVLSIQIAKSMAEAGCAVAALLADEGREAGIIRLGQQFGWDRAELEQNHDGVLDAFERDTAALPLWFPDPDAETWTMALVTEALCTASPDAPKLLLVDSVQTVRSGLSLREQGALRERIMASAREARRLAQDHNLIVILTSEVNRGFYRAKKEEDRISDLAAFAEARIEYAGDVGLILWASQEDPDLVEVRIPKNRLGTRQGFLLRLDRVRARFDLVDGDPRQDLRDQKTEEKVEKAREDILRALTAHPGLTRLQLQDEVPVKREHFVKALQGLKADGFVRTEPDGKMIRHYLGEVPR